MQPLFGFDSCTSKQRGGGEKGGPVTIQLVQGDSGFESALRCLPAQLRGVNWLPGRDHLGVPLVEMTYEPARVREATERADTSLCGRYYAAFDPNIHDLFTVYLLNSGAVLSVGRGWAQRILDTVGRELSRVENAMAGLVNARLEDKLTEFSGKTPTNKELADMKRSCAGSLAREDAEYQKLTRLEFEVRWYGAPKFSCSQTHLHCCCVGVASN